MKKDYFLNYYLENIKQKQKQNEKNMEEMENSIRRTAEEVSNYFFGSGDRDINKQKTFLLFGEVQSGKTSHLFGAISQVADKGCRIFILLTSNNDLLHTQTHTRAKCDLTAFSVFSEQDQHSFENHYDTRTPILIVLKKHKRVLENWKDTLKSSNKLDRSNYLFIADDEADNASQNTRINSKGSEKSAINKNIEELRELVDSSFYLQITGTPHALLLQPKDSLLKPSSYYYFSPGENYVGGKFFFATKSIKENENIFQIDKKTTKKEESELIKKVMLRHWIVATQALLSEKVERISCLIHQNSKQAKHSSAKELANYWLQWAKEFREKDEFKDIVREIYDDEELFSCDSKKNFEEIYAYIRNNLLDETQVVVKNAVNYTKKTDNSSHLKQKCNFIIGGNSLGRGVTIPNLYTVLYSRDNKVSQMDTIWQHNRIFGYDRDKKLIKLFTTKLIYDKFYDCQKTNENLVNFICEKPKEDGTPVTIQVRQNLKATRDNVLLKETLVRMGGGINYYFQNPVNKTIEKIDKLLENYTIESSVIRESATQTLSIHYVDLSLVKKILDCIDPTSEEKLLVYKSIISTALSNHEDAILIVCRGRNVKRSGRSLLDPQVRKAGRGGAELDEEDRYRNKLVLTMYEITNGSDWEESEKWSSDRIWVPNIKLPGDKDSSYIGSFSREENNNELIFQAFK